jgi:CHASE2 domain-containing sensor protein
MRDIKGVSDLNVCDEREFLSHLLDRIDAADPAVIVVDKYFGRETCPANDPGTEDLLRTVERIREKRHSVVVGLKATDLGEEGGADRPSSFIDDSLQFRPVGLSGQEGIVNLPEDTRRLPLQWTLYGPGEGEKHHTVVIENTLALAAALDYDAHLVANDPRLRHLLANGEHPFMGFLPTARWAGTDRHYYASMVLCGRPIGPDEKWQNCKPSTPPPSGMNHRVVVVGENDPDHDSHRSVVGTVPGFYLQANYIEALLDYQFLRPGGAIWDDGAGFVFLLALELILVVWRDRIIVAVALISGLLLMSYVFLYVMAVNVGYYVDPVPVEATAVAIKILQLWVPSPEASTRASRSRSRAAVNSAER